MRIELVQNIDEIIENINTIEEYIAKKTDPEYTYGLNLIKKGTCFVKYNERFYPSRFIGYKSNTMDKHENNEERDGRVTNKRISQILGVTKPEINNEFDKEYREFCRTLGIEAGEKGSFGAERKYWKA